MQAFQLMRFSAAFLTGIILAHSGLSLPSIGTYESLVFLSAATGFFWVNGISGAFAGRFATDTERSERRKINDTYNLLILCSLLITTLLFFLKPMVIAWAGPELESSYPVFLAFVFLNNIGFINESILLVRKRAIGLVLYGIFLLLSHLIGVVLVLSQGGGIHSLLLLLLAIAATRNLLALALIGREGFELPTRSGIVAMAAASAPLVFSMLISGSAETIDGLIVGHFLGPDAFAVFRYGARELPFATLLAAALSSAMVAGLAQNGMSAESMGELKRETAGLMHLVFPVSIGLVLSSHIIFPLFFSEAFAESASVFNIYLLLVIARVCFPQTLVMAMGRNDLIFKTALIELPVNIVCSLGLLFVAGIEGVAWGTVIAFSTEKTVLYFRLKRETPHRLHDFHPIKLWLVYSLLLLGAYCVSEFIVNQ
ncbi:MAG: lipopolysaccharide biosynthesis protein [Bacteroidota bacterium]